jgi:hypothetical protein
MRKIIEASIDKQDEKNEKDAKRDRNLKAAAGLATLSLLNQSSSKRERQKLMNDIMYYLRKLINLAKRVQNLSESVGDSLSDKDLLEFEDLKSEIEDLESSIKEKS